MIYVFPFHALVGTEGGTLYTYGYIPYTIFKYCNGRVPLAVSKFVSKYNALGDYKTSRRMFRSGMVMMIVTGVLSFLVLYMTAPLFAEAMLGKQSVHSNIGEVTTIIRLVSFALIVVPAASLIRGYFQGHQSMGPTTVSQIIEQIIRIVFLLAGSFIVVTTIIRLVSFALIVVPAASLIRGYFKVTNRWDQLLFRKLLNKLFVSSFISGSFIVIKVLGGTVATAVGVATFAAFVSAVGALGVLIWYWLKRKNIWINI